jgi:AraC family transcriptional regulator
MIAESAPATAPLAAHLDRGVLRALALMRKRMAEPLSLREMAGAAHQSPYHFLRTFSRATGLSPGRFLGAIRLKAAVRLLLTTDLSVTDVCFASGYNSLGTFTRRFSEVIGVPPGRLRMPLPAGVDGRAPATGDAMAGHGRESLPGGTTVRGRVAGGEDRGGRARLIFVGLFATHSPQGFPAACALLRSPGAFALRGVADGVYYLLGAAVRDASSLWDNFLREHPEFLAGSLQAPVRVEAGAVRGPTLLALRLPRPTDPPLLICLPLLLLRDQGVWPAAAAPRGPRRAPGVSA